MPGMLEGRHRTKEPPMGHRGLGKHKDLSYTATAKARQLFLNFT
jgi:hypothetical protein